MECSISAIYHHSQTNYGLGLHLTMHGAALSFEVEELLALAGEQLAVKQRKYAGPSVNMSEN